jgi:hypothetical protein
MFGVPIATLQAIGATIAALGIGSVVGSFISSRGARTTAIAQLRQNWIDALRNDIVEYLKHVDVLHGLMNASASQNVLKAASVEAMIPYRKLLLRLNLREPLHRDLAKEMAKLHFIKGAIPDSPQIDEVLYRAQAVLKYEWRVAKGVWALKARLWLSRLAGRKSENLVAAIHEEVLQERMQIAGKLESDETQQADPTHP